MLKTRIQNQILYSGITKAEYEKIKPRIERKNYNMLKIMSVTGATLLLELLAASYFVPALEKNRTLYLSVFMIMAAIYVAAKTIVKKKPFLTLLFCYLFLLTAFSFAIILGVPLTKNMVATTFSVLLFALPLLIVDQPYRLSLLLIFVSAMFSLFSLHDKPRQIASIDVVNAASFAFLGIVVNFFTMKTKISEICNRIYIEKERDTDSLTKLKTKAAANRKIEEFIREGNQKAALLVLDIDNFKKINDTMGHAYGDAVIRVMGECIFSVFRSNDILARFGGDEFILFLTGTSDVNTIRKRVEYFVQIVEERLTTKEKAVQVTVSVGIALFPEDADTFEDLFKKADEALYCSKARGKNCYTFYFEKDLI